mgnify:CR=1 FL=1
MREITQVQRDVLNYIADFIDQNGYPPTVREVSERFGKSIRAVQDNMVALQKKGYISLAQKKSRSIRILIDERQKDQKMFVDKIPLVGTIAAGKPLLSEENLEGYVTLAEPFIRPGKSYFALRVRGQSMLGAGILEGDLAIVEQANDAIDGQIVVAVLDDAITLKRYYKEQNRIRLQPENPAFNPIYCTDVRIVGILANLVRTY